MLLSGSTGQPKPRTTPDEVVRAAPKTNLVPGFLGFTVTDHIRTETEEIDLTILNDSTDPRFKREDALLLAECKNWSAKCGKNEFVIFKEKIENRSQRCSLGFLVSWNGFAETVTKRDVTG